MRNSMKIVSVAAILGIGSLWAETIPIKAVELTQESIEAEQTDVEDNINKANSKISKLQEEQAKASQEVEKLNNAISGTLQQINEKNQQTEEAKSKIETLQKEISEITGRIEKRNGLLKDRARSFQENGGEVSYIDVIFGAKSFTDFVDRAGAVAVIMEADRDLLEKHETDKNSLEKLKEDLNLKKEEQNRIIGQLQESEKAVKAEVLSLEKERIILVNKKTEIENKKLTEQKNQSIAAAQNNQNGQGSAGTVSESPKVAQANGNGSFIWPTIGGVITTYQGMRWGSFHKGIDIARPADYSILAADSGKVTFAGWKNGYGNTIVIEHNNGYKTQYSHMDSLNVNAGEAVSQGSKIGIMGSTGFSTGIHLDFEVYYNGKLLNPMDVLPGR